MLNKTKAALQSRLCRTDLCQLDSQDNTVIALVNTEAGFPASVTVIPVSLRQTAKSGEDLRVSDADAQREQAHESVLRVTQSHAQPKPPMIWVVNDRLSPSESVPAFCSIDGYNASSIGGLDTHNLGIELQICNSSFQAPLAHLNLCRLNFEPADFIYFSLSRFSNLWQTEVSWSFRYLLQVAGGAEMNFTAKKTTAMMMNRYTNLRIAHPFFSVTRCASSLRMMRFIQADTDASPSWETAFLISLSRSSSTRNAICLLPLPLIEMVDTWLTPFYSLICLKCMTSVNQKATPCSARNTYRASNHIVNGGNIMASAHDNQTRPKYQYRFLALCREDMQAKPCRLSVEAETEQEARRVLAPHFILSLAARLPIQGMNHA